MEQNFQTSFIPKKPVVNERVAASKPISPILILALFFLFLVLLVSGGLFFYKGISARSIENMKKNLGLAQNRFEPSKIAELKLLDRRLQAGKQIIDGHIAVTPIFQALEKVTLKTVRFTNFDYAKTDDANVPILVRMSGQAVGYRSIALQADILSKNKNFIDPVFSNLTLDQSGNVLFDLEFSVDPASLNYRQTLSIES